MLARAHDHFATSLRILTLVLLLLLRGALAQTSEVDPENAFFDHYGRSQGLSNSAVSSIIQDEHGFLWFGTQGGLNRFDGRRVLSFTHEPFSNRSLPHDLIQTMYADPQEPYLWIGTYRGVSRFNRTTQEFTNYRREVNDPNSLSNDVVTAITRDTDGSLWVGTLNGLNHLDPETGHVERTRTTGGLPGLPDNTIRALKQDWEDRIWIATYGGLGLMEGNRDRIVRALGPEELPSSAVLTIHVDEREQVLWLGLWDGGVLRYDPASGETRRYTLPDDRVYTVIGNADYIFAGTWGGGLYRLDKGSGEIDSFRSDVTRPFTLSHDTVYSLAFDDSGALWIGTNGGGVNRLSSRKRNYLRFYSRPTDTTSIPPGDITAIHRDSHGVLWIGSYNGGLSRYDPQRDAMIHYRANGRGDRELSNDIVTMIFEDSRGTLWVGTNEGLNRYNRERDRFSTLYHDPNDPRSVPDDIIYAMEEDGNGSLWLGTYSRGISRWDPESGGFTHYPHIPKDPRSLSDNLVYDILRDSEDRLWVATNRGLNRFDRETGEWIKYFHVPGTPGSLSTDSIRRLFEAADGSIWIGTASGGVNRFHPDTQSFTHYTGADGLADNTVTAIQQDDHGRLWFATTYGLSVFDPDTGEFENLDVDDGLGGMEFNFGSMRDQAGALWFGGTHGVTVVDDTALRHNAHPPAIEITGVEVMSQPIPSQGQTFTGDTLDLSQQDNSISFEFIALDYAAPRSNEYRYMLEGFDRDWIDNGSRNFTTYTNLPAGSYTFRVDGSNSDGVWSGDPASLRVTIPRPFYARWWAFAAYAAFLVVIALVVLRLRDRRLLQAQVAQLHDQRNRLEDDNRLLGRMSMTDSLTGIYNRRYFDWRLNDSWQRAQKSGWALSLLMLDIDYFKLFNDTYGHPEGDTALQDVAGVLKSRVSRASDVVARYGGEEFAVLLHGVDDAGARQVAENIRHAVEEERIPHDASDISDVVTVSTGFCTVRPEAGGSPKTLLAGADRALYEAKQAGRNVSRSCNGQ